MTSETRAVQKSKIPIAIAIVRKFPKNRTWGRELGRPRRRNIPVAKAIGAEFPKKSHMASETRAVATSGNPSRDIYSSQILPAIEKFGDFRHNYRPPAFVDVLKLSVGANAIRNFPKLIEREAGNSGGPDIEISQSRQL